MPLDSQQLLRLSKDELDDLFARSSAGNLPDGEGTGTALLCPGSILGRILAWLTRWFVWQGDVFHADKGLLYNRISALWIPCTERKGFQGSKPDRSKRMHRHGLFRELADAAGNSRRDARGRPRSLPGNNCGRSQTNRPIRSQLSISTGAKLLEAHLGNRGTGDANCCRVSGSSFSA